MTAQDDAKNWRNFLMIWFGQVISLFGSNLTSFGLGVWVYQQTGSATTFALIFVAGSIPSLLISPIAGGFVDRWDRRRTMIGSDAAVAAGTVALIALLYFDKLSIGFIYIIVAYAACIMAFQIPAFTASIPLLVPKQHFGRVAGLMQFGPSAARILGPLAAGILLPIIDLEGIIAIDLATFGIAVLMTFLAKIPRPPAPAGPRPSLWTEIGHGWTYIVSRPGFVALLFFFAVLNLFFSAAQVLVTPLVLSFSTSAQLGMVMALGSIGGLVGSLLISAWGGPQKRLLGVMLFAPLIGLSMVITGAWPLILLIAAGYFLMFFIVPIVNGADQALWQSKVEPALQGRVFALKRTLSQFTAPIGFFLAGPLADRIFEPAFRADAPAGFGGLPALLGSGPGRGIGAMFVIMGLIEIGVALIFFAHPRLRHFEEEVPDYNPDSPPKEAH